MCSATATPSTTQPSLSGCCRGVLVAFSLTVPISFLKRCAQAMGGQRRLFICRWPHSCSHRPNSNQSPDWSNPSPDSQQQQQYEHHDRVCECSRSSNLWDVFLNDYFLRLFLPPNKYIFFSSSSSLLIHTALRQFLQHSNLRNLFCKTSVSILINLNVHSRKPNLLVRIPANLLVSTPSTSVCVPADLLPPPGRRRRLGPGCALRQPPGF